MVLRQDVIGDRGDEGFRHRGDLVAHPAGEFENGREGHPDAEQLGAGSEQAGPMHAEALADGAEQPELDCTVEVALIDRRPEQLVEFRATQLLRQLTRGRGQQRRLEAERLTEVVAALPRGDEVRDVGDGVSPLEQPSDQPEPGEVRLVVEVDPTDPPWGGEQAALGVGPHVPDGDAGGVGEVIQSVLERRGRASPATQLPLSPTATGSTVPSTPQ